MQTLSSFITTNWINLLALSWFLLCFKGYNFYTYKRARNTYCLANLMHQYRYAWMTQLLARDSRIADTAAIANLERSVSFFASATMLVLAGLMTVLGSTEKAIDIIKDIPFAAQTSKAEWEIKLLLLIGLFIYAFFKFTWSLRQYGFTTVMIGAAPMPQGEPTDQELKAHANRLAAMSSMAAHNFNLGLRSYYFSMAVLGWFVNPWLFMVLTAGILVILYRREFKSSTLRQLVISHTD